MVDPLSIIYQDSDLLVIDKPPGLTVTPTETDSSITLADILKKDFAIDLDRAGIVHRLDKDTSGLILVAKTNDSLQNLQAQFQARIVKKTYLCLVHGFLDSDRVVEGAIGRNPKNREKFTVIDDGKEASTKFSPVKKYSLTDEAILGLYPEFSKIQLRKLDRLSYQKYTLVSCEPLTGRTHQIRVHLKHIGFPIVGDSKYGGRKVARLDKRWCARQFLHAAKIKFIHPSTQKEMEFESPLPQDLASALSILE